MIEDVVKTASGAIIHKPQQTVAQERGGVDRGTVIGVGPDAYKDPDRFTSIWVKVGDRVIWPRYAGRWLRDTADGDLYVINDEDVLAIYKETEDG